MTTAAPSMHQTAISRSQNTEDRERQVAGRELIRGIPIGSKFSSATEDVAEGRRNQVERDEDERDCDRETSSPANGNEATGCRRLPPRRSRRLQSVDSRSILNNKEKLKRFWEKKMELELSESKLRMPTRRTSLARISHDADQLVNGSLKDDLIDENNNENDSNNNNNNSDNSEQADNKCHSRQGEPTISAQLLCEKLMAVKNSQRAISSYCNGAKPLDVGCNKNNNNNNNQQQADEAQPMSIDPVLCHLHEDGRDLAGSGLLVHANRVEDCEEQYANEEFSSSNSSFGPLSMPVAAKTKKPTSGASSQRATDSSDDCDDDDDNNEDDEEENSTQSGSVLTVINGGVDKQSTAGEQPASEPPASSTCAADSQQLTNSAALISSIEDELDDEDDDEDGGRSVTDEGEGDDEEEDEDEGGSNIGVAFESLQFDDEIKSSRTELVDEELLLADGRRRAQTRRATAGGASLKPPVESAGWLRANPTTTTTATTNNCSRPMPRFDSREVKSVCSLITSAVTDAGKQVDAYIKSMSVRRADSSDGPELDCNAQASAKAAEFEGHGEGSGGSEEEETTNEGGRRNRSQDCGLQQAKFVAECRQQVGANRQHNAAATRQSPERFAADANESRSNHLVATTSALEAADSREANYDESSSLIDSEGSSLDDGLVDQEGEADSQQVDQQRADLSSMFEANVRREIERFESNAVQLDQHQQRANQEVAAANFSGCGKAIGGGGGQQRPVLPPSKVGLTEWRIAEEIRLFNERESELKQRSASGRQMAPNSRPGPTQTKPADNQHQLEAVVRHGKTLLIPRHSRSCAKPQHNQQSQPQPQSAAQVARSIKLSTSVTDGDQSQPPTMISMHKFISSRGKRFVYKQTSPIVASAGDQQTEVASSNANHMTKSMSNLCSPGSQAGRQIDCRAVDSMASREVPNVMPGLAKKTIETFRRLAGCESGSLNQLNLGATPAQFGPNRRARADDRTKVGRPSHQARARHIPDGSAPSAEWKIQQELREMKAREAELRGMRNEQRLRQQRSVSVSDEHNIETCQTTDEAAENGRLRSQSASRHECELDPMSDSSKCPSEMSSDATRSAAKPNPLRSSRSVSWDQSTGETKMAPKPAAIAKKLDGRRSDLEVEDYLAGHSLYPIRQTIDSFRKMNASVDLTRSNLARNQDARC